jgi:hypothetical protein
MDTKNSAAERKIFDDYEVECNECEKYWCNQCDGVKPNQRRKCTSYVAVKRVDIPKRVDQNYQEINHLKTWLVISNIALIIHIILDLLVGCGL